MPDDQHDHDPEVPAEPDGQQAPGADQENDEKEPPRRRRNTIRELSEEFEKATGRPAPGIATPGVYAATEALRQVLDSPSQRLLRDSLAARLSPGLTTFASALDDLGFGDSLAARLSPGLTTFASALDDLGFDDSLAARLSPGLTTFASALDDLDLRHLMPGGALSRNEAFRLAGSTLWERLQAVDPENWRGERLGRPDMLAVMEEGIPLVWTPSADVIRELLDAPDAPTRRKVLERQAPAVVEDCRTVLTDVARTDLASEVDFLHDCLDSIGNGKYAAAQVLASSVLDTILRAMVRADPRLQNNKGGFTFNILAAQLPKATRDTLVGQFRAYCIHTSIHKAYEQYFGPPVPEEYNRHATAHAAGPTQITLANALAAVMLAVGLVREMEETQRPLSPAG
ncbi:hypothetical protein AB0M25_06350 [Streptomyces griseomycini]|uniref:hypothetical protein n=2 Tax=Streptomyces TaxID=1883 RepID=UPI0034287D25